MNKKLLKSLSLTLLLGIGLSACGGGGSTSTNSEPNPSNTPTSETSSPDVSEEKSEDPVSEEEPPVVSEEPTSEEEKEPEKMPIYYKALNEGARTRAYDERFDLMVDDFSAGSLIGTASGDATHVNKNFLRVSLESSDAETYPTTPDKAIYKQAPKSGDVHAQEGIGFRMRLVAGEVDYDNLILGLRGADGLQVFELPLSSALDVMGEELPALSEEYQDIIISPNMSIDDANTVYKNPDGTDSATKVLDTIVGFHLYARNEIHAIVEIEKVFGVNGTAETVYDDFNREATNGALDTAWWNDSTGYIVQKSISGKESGSYKVTAEGVADYANVVVSVASQTNGITIAPINGDVVGSAVAWADLKDDENNALVAPVNGCYGNYVINLANSGIPSENLNGFEIAYTSEFSMSKVFMTNMQVPEAAKSFPMIDSANAVIFDDFSRTQNQFANNYDAGNSVVDSTINDAGLNHVISYNNGSMLKVGDGHITFDATNLGDGYIQLTEGSKVGRTNQQYMVISAKTEEGATLDGFRLHASGAAVWYNDFYAAQGLKSNDTTNPYVDENGYTWIVIDLALSGLSDVKDEINFYYSSSNGGKLHIDSIFFADRPFERTVFPGEATKVMDATDSSHQWASLGANNGGKVIEVVYKGNGTNDLSSFRLESTNNNAIFANAGLPMTVNGQAVDHTFVAPAETETTLVIDLEAAGWTDFFADITLVLGDWAPGYMDIVTARSVKEKETASWKELRGDFGTQTLAPTNDDPHAWFYVGWNGNKAKQIRMKFVGDGVATLETFRFESPDNDAIYANATLAMYVNGEKIAASYVIPAEGVVITFDLEESGWANLQTNINAVYGDWAPETWGTISVSECEVYEETSIASIMASLATRVIPE